MIKPYFDELQNVDLEAASFMGWLGQWSELSEVLAEHGTWLHTRCCTKVATPCTAF